jgi:hypothetical protein
MKKKQIILIHLCLLAFISCITNKPNVIALSNDNGLIKDCPEELIQNHMPRIGKSTIPSGYYIYKGFRKEIADFDSAWVSKNCNVKVTNVY